MSVKKNVEEEGYSWINKLECLVYVMPSIEVVEVMIFSHLCGN